MGILKGMLTVRRYEIVGQIPTDWGHEFHQKLQQHSFHGASLLSGKDETMGWTLIQNLLDTDFSEIDNWLIEHYVFAMLRVDKKNVPPNLFRAHFEKLCAEWCDNNDKTYCPARIKEDIKDSVRAKLVSKSLPKVTTVEFCWNVKENFLLFHNTSDGMNDRFIKLFYDTFGLRLQPSPLVKCLPDQVRSYIESCGASDLSHAGANNGSY
jgi:hypothetical protein